MIAAEPKIEATRGALSEPSINANPAPNEPIACPTAPAA
jgi:hypothetical protein